MTRQPSRRSYLAAIGGIASLTTLAGCTGSTDSGDAGGASGSTDTTASPSSTDAVSETETETETATTTEAPTRTVTDMIGREVTVPSTVESVIPMGSGGLRMVAYVDATDRVVAVEDQETGSERDTRPYLLANPSLADKPSIGSRKDPSVETIIQQDPDVVIWGYAGAEKANALQERTGIPVVVVTPGALTDPVRGQFYDALDFVGGLLGQADEASELAAYTRTELERIAERRPETGPESPRAYIGYLGRGKHGLLYTQPNYPAFSVTGAYNVASVVTEDLKTKKGAARTTVNPESFIEWDPEYVFVDLGGESYDDLSNPEYEGVTAIEQEQVYGVLPTRDYSTNFGTSLANAFYVASVLFPDSYDVDPVAKADEIYEQFVGAPIYEKATEAYGSFGQLTVGE